MGPAPEPPGASTRYPPGRCQHGTSPSEDLVTGIQGARPPTERRAVGTGPALHLKAPTPSATVFSRVVFLLYTPADGKMSK